MTTPMQPGAPGGAQSLSNAQFGAVPMPALPVAHGMTSGSEPRPAVAGGAPLNQMAGTFGSAKSAATWRKPPGVMPLSKATIGSTFQPFGPQ